MLDTVKSADVRNTDHMSWSEDTMISVQTGDIASQCDRFGFASNPPKENVSARIFLSEIEHSLNKNTQINKQNYKHHLGPVCSVGEVGSGRTIFPGSARSYSFVVFLASSSVNCLRLALRTGRPPPQEG